MKAFGRVLLLATSVVIGLGLAAWLILATDSSTLQSRHVQHLSARRAGQMNGLCCRRQDPTLARRVRYPPIAAG